VAHSDKISELVQTVRQLNWEVRPKISTTAGANEAGSPLHTALTELRNNEIRTSQLIRGMSLSETPVAGADVGRVIEHVEASTIGSRQLLSEFATAREAILSILRNLSDEDWTAPQNTAEGEFTYEGVVDSLIESDRQRVGQILSTTA
jgi:hypothetical protein